MTSNPEGGKTSRIKLILILGIVFIAGVVFTGLFNVGLSATNTTEFCTGCHTMQTPYNELKESEHYSNTSGVHAGCQDCHVPKSFFPKMQAKILAAKDVWHEMLGTIDTPEKYEAYRWKMANRVWDKMKATDSRECRSCHSFDHMDLSSQGRSARNRHGRAEDEGDTCIDCHKGIAHEEPDEPDEEENES
ncbi:MAG: cytochrome C [Gammaproteobacteria bacterium]|nr:cytochrome C [Gammaproteobacteria bacterium]